MQKLIIAPLLLLASVNCFADLKVSSPSQACSLLSGSSLSGGTWRDLEDGTWGCSSDYLDIGSGNPLPNNLAYYVEGSVVSPTQVYLVLNYFKPKSKDAATKALVSASSVLSQKALGAKLPVVITKAIMSGQPATSEAGSGVINVLRDDWPNGKGYEIHVLMK
ncbi:hypothetical protein EXW72_10245 [Pseudomonas sp. BCA14]|uniref:hypothetical protein n=1 Tax=Pseudomonas TaxID=286 RepID=UPI00106EAFDB|nr:MULTISPECIES: hypothetical protein [unclassified Pseudomonas]TFF09700.1 hypothetical protein EXW70_11745 [Pseudomonas sp. JMN1]TFF11842.1 hypothetical protein EXW71_09495 [Pseudomonas sp. BCA17]TFF28618.1 hypothetical protein EXW72_10245 [Pseudomonas sp. BCA14]